MPVCQALPHRVECEDCDINSHPLAFEGMRCVNRGAAAAEGIENDVAFVAGGGYQAFVECDRVFGSGSRDVLWKPLPVDLCLS